MAVSLPPEKPFWSRFRAIYAPSVLPGRRRDKSGPFGTILLPTSTSNGKAEQLHSGNVNSASFRRRQGAIPPATSGAEQGLIGKPRFDVVAFRFCTLGFSMTQNFEMDFSRA
jgi:hypothetical protein